MEITTPALDYARNLGANFPFLRPAGEASERFADEVAAELFGVDGEVPDERLAEGVRLVDADERAELVEAYAARFPEVWDGLCRDLGRERAERELVESAVRAAVNERREPPPFLVAALEDPHMPDLPYHAVSCVLAHDDVWSLDDALAAAGAAAGAEALPAAWEEAIVAVARARLEPVHLERVRAHASRLERLLPFEGLPRASELLERGCEEVARDGRVAADVAVSLLRNYVVHLVGPPTLQLRN